jgi:hypothetical protein
MPKGSGLSQSQWTHAVNGKQYSKLTPETISSYFKGIGHDPSTSKYAQMTVCELQACLTELGDPKIKGASKKKQALIAACVFMSDAHKNGLGPHLPCSLAMYRQRCACQINIWFPQHGTFKIAFSARIQSWESLVAIRRYRLLLLVARHNCSFLMSQDSPPHQLACKCVDSTCHELCLQTVRASVRICHKI